jgi:hypothetical protein
MPPGVCTICRKAPAERGSKFGQAEGQAAISQASVLWTVKAIDARRAVARRKLCESRRGRRIVLASVAGREFILARFGCLQQGEAKFALGNGSLLSHQCQRRNLAVGRIDNHSGALKETRVT